MPEAGLLPEPENPLIRQGPTGQRRLPMVRGGLTCTLCQFLKLTPKHIVELQLFCDLPRNIEVICAPRIQVQLLQQQNVRLDATQKFDDPRQLKPAIDVPAHDLD